MRLEVRVADLRSHSSKSNGADARIVAGRQRPIVQLGAEIARVDIRNDLARIPDRAQIAPDEVVERNALGPAISIVPFTGAPSVTSAMASATSSEAIGCRWAGER